MDLNVNVTVSFPQLTLLFPQLDRLQHSLESKMATLQEDIDALTKSEADLKAGDAKAIALLNSLSGQLTAALASAAAAGATPAQLQALTDLNASMVADTAAVADAVTVNTPPPAAAPAA